MKKRVLFICIASTLILSGCHDANSSMEDQCIELQSESEEESYADVLHFTLIEEGYATPVKTQISGTCWVTAASTSMESAFKMKNKEDIVIDPMDILNAVQGTDKAEGYFVKDGINGAGIGGWAWQIVETLSNGFGEYILIDAPDYSTASIEELKNAIAKEGGINVAVNDARSDRFGIYNGETTLNDPDSDDFDHEVVLVGWDDMFPRENFKVQAQKNGAWLAQNTHGSAWGKDGFYWISYETPFREQTIFKLSKDYKEVVSYDGGNENRIQTGDTTVVANVYHNEGVLKAIGTYITKPGQKIVVEIYDEAMKEKLAFCEATFPLMGYHTLQLKEPLEVKDFAVVVRYEGEAPVEGELWEDAWVTYDVGIHPKESFVLLEDKWYDLSEGDTIKKLGVDFTPNNCCIKAIF